VEFGPTTKNTTVQLFLTPPFSFGSTARNVAIGTMVGGKNSNMTTKKTMARKTYDFLSQ